MEFYFLATSTGTRPELFEGLVVSFNMLALPVGAGATLLVLDQAPAVHDEIFARHPAADGKTITRLKSDRLLGLSVARNRLLSQLNGTGYVLFCDDDATYAVDFLCCLQDELVTSGNREIGLFRLMNKEGGGTYGNRRYPKVRRPLKRGELVNLAISLNLVMKLECINAAGGFNEDLGVGSKGLCGEETELVLKAIDLGARSAYFNSPIAYHPRQDLDDTTLAKIYRYSRGYRDMLLSYRGSPSLKCLVRFHLLIAIARSAAALIVQPGRKNRFVKIKGLLGLSFDGASDA